MKVVDDDGTKSRGRGRRDRDPGPQRHEGLLGRAEATAEVIRDGWFPSGDMGTIDEDGYFFIVDRKKDMIIRGGYNVYPREIESALRAPGGLRGAVIGVPDDALGEEVGAAVVLKQGAEATRRTPRLRQGAGRRLQVPAQDLVLRRAAQGPDGQDPQARDQSARRLTSVTPSARPSRTESTRVVGGDPLVEVATVRLRSSWGSTTRPRRRVLSSTSRPPGRSRRTSAS